MKASIIAEHHVYLAMSKDKTELHTSSTEFKLSMYLRYIVTLLQGSISYV